MFRLDWRALLPRPVLALDLAAAYRQAVTETGTGKFNDRKKKEIKTKQEKDNILPYRRLLSCSNILINAIFYFSGILKLSV